MTRKEIFLRPLYMAVMAPVTTVLAQATFAEQTVIVPLSPSLEQVSLYLDRSSSHLDLSLELVEKGELASARAALNNYTRELSRFHVALGRLRMGKGEREFVLVVSQRLEVQRIRLQSLSEDGQPAVRDVLKEANGHLESALQMAKQKLDRSGFGGLSLKRYGTETARSEKEKLNPGRAATSLDASRLQENGRSR